MYFPKPKYNFPWWLVFPGVAVCTFVITELAARHPARVEAVYTQEIYPIIASTLSAISNLIPFSLDDLFYSLLITFIIFLISLCSGTRKSPPIWRYQRSRSQFLRVAGLHKQSVETFEVFG